MPAERDFIAVLKDLNQGGTVQELTDELSKLMGAVKLAGKSGTLTLTLHFKPTGKGSQIEVKDTISTKPPKAAPGTTVLFVNDDNQLQRNDPRQPALTGLRSVSEFPDRKSEATKS